jgi:soluble lytic murein transglycosylase-like protein
MIGAGMLFTVAWVIDRVNDVETRNLDEALVESTPTGAAPPREPTETTPVSVGEASAPAANPFAAKVLAFVHVRANEESQLAREGIDRSWFEQLATYAVDVTQGSWVDPALLVAISWRESRWRDDALGAAGEIGLMQLLGPEARQGYTRAAVAESPSLNLWLGVRHLERSKLACGDLQSALLQYASGSCSGPSDPEAKARAIASVMRVLRWRRELR